MLRRSCLAFAILVMLPAAASAGSFTYYGPHLGFTQGPDDFLIGGHLQWNGVAPRVAFVPGLDMAFGNDLSLVTLNGDFHYQLATSTRWQPYVGGGVGLNFTSGGNAGGSDPNAGGHVIVGAAVPNGSGSRFFAELKLGLGDDTDLKALAGWNFHAR